MEDKMKHPNLGQEVGARENRKMKAIRRGRKGTWLGFGMFGLIGWSVVIPTLLGTMLGIWMDKQYPAKHSWTLTFLVVGLLLGVWNAWRWLSRESRQIQKDEEEIPHNQNA